MAALSFKKFAATAALSGAFGVAAFGLGMGTASADDEQDGSGAGDWQQYLPVDQLPGLAGTGDLQNIVGGSGDFGTFGSGPVDLQNIPGQDQLTEIVAGLGV